MAGLSLSFGGGPPLLAEFLPDAPRTAAAMAMLFATPREAPALHACYDGPEVMATFEAQTLAVPSVVAEELRRLPLENATCHPSPGDVIWFSFPPFTLPGQRGELWEVALPYAPGVRLFGPLGWTPATVFARLPTAALPALQAVGKGIRRHGECPVSIAARA